MIYVSVISHSHDELLVESGLLSEMAGRADLVVLLKDNVPSPRMKQLCEALGVLYVDEAPYRGFGENNNIVFRHIERSVGFAAGDFFVAVNPDIRISISVLTDFIEALRSDARRFGTLNLYKDEAMTVYDLSVRKFPSFLDVLTSRILGKVRNQYDKSKILQPCVVEWASGALLAFDWALYRDLGGFDERYFMYFEDVDICWRAKRDFDVLLYFYPQYRAVHFAQHANRKLLSLHAWWFLKGFYRFKFNRAMQQVLR